MRIRVINAKNMSRYCSKILILIAIVFIFGKFLNNRNINASLGTNSSSLLNIINRKNTFLNNKNFLNYRNNGKWLNYRYFNSKKVNISKEMINNELGLVKMVANQNNISVVADEQEDLDNLAVNQSKEDFQEENTDNIGESQEAEAVIEEPATRTKHRNFAFKCAR